ncbi:hypothetical protein, partial [Klebsiella michiganensis]|uniref:hypothetical protein n=3 Tax=Klebsiella michiganensis TaxID=1134687 RepID=UPI001954B9D8
PSNIIFACSLFALSLQKSGGNQRLRNKHIIYKYNLTIHRAHEAYGQQKSYKTNHNPMLLKDINTINKFSNINTI